MRRINEPLAGAVDGLNKLFSSSEPPDAGSLSVFVDMAPAAMLSVVGKDITLSTAPAIGSQVFGAYTVTSADDIDLTTLEAVKAWGEIKGTSEDSVIQAAITGFSKHIHLRTGRDALKSIEDFTEVYDGNGSPRMLLRNYPIVSVTSVLVDGSPAAIAPGYGVAGVTIIEEKKGIGFGFGSSGRFTQGIANIQVIYQAGYDGVPVDLELAVREAVATNYKRRAWADLKSKSIAVQGTTGTTTYRDWKLTPQIEAIIDDYTRLWSV